MRTLKEQLELLAEAESVYPHWKFYLSQGSDWNSIIIDVGRGRGLKKCQEWTNFGGKRIKRTSAANSPGLKTITPEEAKKIVESEPRVGKRDWPNLLKAASQLDAEQDLQARLKSSAKSVKEETELQEVKVENKPFTPQMLQKLKTEYGKLKKIDPASETSKKMMKLLDSLSQEQLKQIFDAKINFLSKLAFNRINREKIKKGEL